MLWKDQPLHPIINYNLNYLLTVLVRVSLVNRLTIIIIIQKAIAKLCQVAKLRAEYLVAKLRVLTYP